ncbi:MAG: hypothetical protein C5B49_16610 [Bdellovibrio sp.]|nr:MAG: hypothetical protein C5B49_16610 [Bdellovibrio sp.]
MPSGQRAGYSLHLKLFSAFMVGAVLLLATGSIAFYFSMKVQSYYEHILRKNIAQERSISRMRDSVNDELRYLTRLSVNLMSDKEYDDVFKKIDGFRLEYKNQEAKLKQVIEGGDQEEDYAALASVGAKLESSVNEVTHLFKTNSTNPDRIRLVSVYYSELEETISELFAKVAKMDSFITDRIKHSEDEASRYSATGNTLTSLAVVLGFLSAFVLGVVLSRYLTRKLSFVAEQLDIQAKAMITVSEQLIKGSEDIRQRTVSQMEAIGKTARSTAEINEKILQNAENSKMSAVRSRESQEAVAGMRTGINQLNEAVGKISDGTLGIANEVQSSHEQMKAVVALIQEISSKTRIINDIVFQTKLLSFNASVEAARAGDSGKGFSVVAEEVGNLARSSGVAADEISSMLGRSVASVEKMVVETKQKVEQLVNDSQSKVDEGIESSENVIVLFESVESGVNDVLSRMDGISQATQEEAEGLRLVQDAFRELETLAGANRTAVLDFERQAGSLRTQSNSVMMAVLQLQEVLRGGQRVA